MIPYKKSFLFGCLVLVINLGLTVHPGGSQSSPLIDCDAGRVRWSDLSFSANNFLAAVDVDVHLGSLSETEVQTALPASPRGVPVQSSSSMVYHLSLSNSVDPIFRPAVKSSHLVWFDPQQGAVLGRIRFRRGKDDFEKKYRFTEQGVFRHQREPKNKQEALLPPEQWTDIKDTFYPHDPDRLGCAYISERLVLMYLVSAAALTPDTEPLSVCVFGIRQLHRVSLRAQGLHSLEVNYIEKDQQTAIRRTGVVEAIKIEIEARPMESSSNVSEDFSILGLHKDIAIFIDPISRIPLQISGYIPGVGQADLKLNEARVRHGNREKSQAHENSERTKKRSD
ncbi:MAG: hypothetical protein V2I56_25875 [Desulfobacteraceae bacterium]|jgi:hypothetical protein|nr:hypothetical protein [Desulfobacteraceae bacterium]